MRLTTKGQYAVRALVTLVLISDGGPVTLKEISKKEEISLHYLEQLFSKLRKGNIVRSVKGPGGGYVLNRDSKDIKVGEIIEMVEEPISPVACVDEGDGGASCNRYDTCATRWLWAELGTKIKDFLNSVSVYDLCREATRKN